MARTFASRRFYSGNAAEGKVGLGQGQAEARPVEGESAFFYKTGLGRLDMSLEKKACMGRKENLCNSGYE